MLVYDVNAAHDYLVRVFGLASGHIEANPDGGTGYRSPRSVGAVTGMTVIFVDDSDAHYARSVAAGAEIVEEPVSQAYGIREYGARDPEGQLWYFHSPLARDASVPGRRGFRPGTSAEL